MKNPVIKNKQYSTSRTFIVLTLISIIVTILPFYDGNPISGIWALAFLGFFFSILSLIIALIFRNRAKKMERLLTGEKLLVHLTLNDEMLHQFASTLKTESKEKNKAIMWVTGVLFALITIPFLFFLESDEIGGFLLIIGSIVLLIFAASRLMPLYYYRKNKNGDQQILIGEKYAYFNGYFHNWDYPLSGLTKVKAIKTPFYGIHLAYYYYDRTWKHVHEIKFPLPENFDPEPVITQLRKANRK